MVSLFGIALFFNLTAFAPTLFFIVAQSHLNQKWWQWLPTILFVSIFGSGMMVNTFRAAWGALRGSPKVFERTPKYGIVQKGQTWQNLNYKIKIDSIVFYEILLGFVNLFSSVMAFRFQHWFISLYTLFFAIGLFFTSIYTIGQSIYGNQKA